MTGRHLLGRRRVCPTGLTRLPVQHVVGFHGRDLGHGGEDMSAVDGSSLQTVAMVDLPLARLLVNAELQHKQTRAHSDASGAAGPAAQRVGNISQVKSALLSMSIHVCTYTDFKLF